MSRAKKKIERDPKFTYENVRDSVIDGCSSKVYSTNKALSKARLLPNQTTNHNAG